MSASEKLKALERGMDEGLVVIMDSEQARAIIDALPQIVAVVEAAEAQQKASEGETLVVLDEALAALDEALSK